MAFFSVIIPLHNKENEVKNTIKSVLDQTFSDFEIIIINDGSTDNSLTVVSQFTDNRIKIHSIENMGVAFARNYGVSLSCGEIITFLDADDYWYADHLDEMARLISLFPNKEWYLAAYELEHNKHLILPMKSPIMKHNKSWRGVVEDYFANSMIDSLALTNTVAMRKSFFNKLGGFDQQYSTGEDTDLWIRAALNTNPVFSTKITSRYILTASNSLSKTPILKRRMIDFDKYEKLHPHNKSLKKYLDLNRFSMALQYKMAGNKKQFKNYYNSIELSNLSHKQLFLLRLPNKILYILKNGQEFMKQFGLRYRTT